VGKRLLVIGSITDTCDTSSRLQGAEKTKLEAYGAETLRAKVRFGEREEGCQLKSSGCRRKKRPKREKRDRETLYFHEDTEKNPKVHREKAGRRTGDKDSFLRGGGRHSRRLGKSAKSKPSGFTADPGWGEIQQRKKSPGMKNSNGGRGGGRKEKEVKRCL